MPEKEQKQAAITGSVTGAFRRFEQPFDFAALRCRRSLSPCSPILSKVFPSEGS
jgi:hypothetical protein